MHGALVAYDATAVVNGKLKQLFHSDANPANNMGNFAKYSTPVVANGKVYVATFSNKVVQYWVLMKTHPDHERHRSRRVSRRRHEARLPAAPQAHAQTQRQQQRRSRTGLSDLEAMTSAVRWRP